MLKIPFRELVGPEDFNIHFYKRHINFLCVL